MNIYINILIKQQHIEFSDILKRMYHDQLVLIKIKITRRYQNIHSRTRKKFF